MPAHILVIGSLNMDLVVTADRFPQPGETIIGKGFNTFPGGKGANQAVAAARLGARVTMVGHVGNDMFGQTLLAALRQDQIDTRHIAVDTGSSSGIAAITVDGKGQNCIIVAPGANENCQPADVDRAMADTARFDVLLLQLEIPLGTVAHAIRRGAAAGKKVILNPAPAAPLPPEIYPLIDVLTPNESEAAWLTGQPVTGVESATRAADLLLGRGVRAVVITLGDKGALVAGPDIRRHIPAVPVPVVDTTAAGDAFSGALACALAEGSDLVAAAGFAACTAALSVTRRGAQTAMPTKAEVRQFMSESGVLKG